MKLLFFFICFTALTYAKLPPTADCKKWFTESGVSPSDRECLLKCGVIGTGMGTFMCPQSCPELCSPRGTAKKVLGRLLYYPGLTPEERKLVNNYPQEALTVFQQKQKAESATMKHFKRDAQDDESDAFRHFMWAGFLSKELGSEMAKRFLDAHESIGRANDPNRAMDLANIAQDC